ncbi:hypothetical protein [Sphingobium bisphenolivorans]|uniref:hypothetical protein n=1 Tax=Sphingobium bisphenolivorans TaxID=1335760 RepID=UPI0003A822A5|nr:hypothetical protein [Sphingobium bisphenolivorans]
MQTQSEDRDDLRNELRDDARNLTGAAKDRLHDEVNTRKAPLADQARSVSSAIDKAAAELGGGNSPAWLKSTLEQGAQQIQRLADRIEQQDSRELVGNVRQLARDNPVTFLTACAAAGFAVSRIFRAEADAGSSAGFGSTAVPAPTASYYSPETAQVPPNIQGGGVI